MKNMSNYFFKPRIGSHYEQGLHGAKTLILGAHFYCSYNDCAFYQVCTKQTDISDMDTRCPVYENQDLSYYTLSNSCEIEIESYLEGFSYYSYHLVTMYLLKATDYISEEQKREFWEQVAFSNYNQHYLPNGYSPSYEENQSLYDNDYPAFETLLQELQPDCIFVWSEPVKDCLMAHKQVKYIGKVNIQTLTVHLFAYQQHYKELIKHLDLTINEKLTVEEIHAMLVKLGLDVASLPYTEDTSRLKQSRKNSLENFLKKSFTQKILVRGDEYLNFATMINSCKELYIVKLKDLYDIPHGKKEALNTLFNYKFNSTAMYDEKTSTKNSMATKILRLFSEVKKQIKQTSKRK